MHKVNITAGEISELLSGVLVGPPDLRLSGFCEPSEVDSASICFIMDKEVLKSLANRSPGLVIIPPNLEGVISSPRIVVKSPSLAMARLMSHLFPQSKLKEFISPNSFVSKSARIGKNVTISPGCVIGEDVEIGDGTEFYPNVVIGDRCKIGSNCTIHPSVSIYHGCKIGNQVILHAGVVIGADGFGFAESENGPQKIPQIGNVVIEDNVEIGANSCVDRATIGTTRIGFGTKLDNQVQIGHNCNIGKFCIICGQVGMAGSVIIGDGVIIAGQVGLADHLKVGDRAVLGPDTSLGIDVAAGESIMGPKGYPAKLYLKCLFYFGRLPEVFRRLKLLEDEKFKKSHDLPDEKALDHSQNDSL